MRRWLTFIAVFLFAAAVVQSVFFDEPRTSTVAADAEVKDERTEPVTDDREPVEQAQNEPTTQYHISSEPLFGGEEQRFVAHRGFSSSAPENSLPAFELAAKCGFWGIETDISESADGVFMCMHDDTMERTTDTGGAISDYTYSQLMEHNITDGTNIDYYKNLKIPTMIELLNVCIMNDLVPVIEIKHISNYDGFVQLINESGLKKRCIVTGAIDTRPRRGNRADGHRLRKCGLREIYRPDRSNRAASRHFVSIYNGDAGYSKRAPQQRYTLRSVVP